MGIWDVFTQNDTTSGYGIAWWRHQMETFSALLAICEGNSPVTGEFPAQRPMTGSFDVLFDLRLNERLSKQWWGWWFEMQSRPLWRHCNVSDTDDISWINENCYAMVDVLAEQFLSKLQHVFLQQNALWLKRSKVINRSRALWFNSIRERIIE